MREMIACAVCLLAIVFVVALSFVFAARHNVAAQPGSVESPPPSVHAPQAPIPASPDLGLAPRPNVGQSEQRAATPDSESVAYGRIVYGRNGCAKHFAPVPMNGIIGGKRRGTALKRNFHWPPRLTNIWRFTPNSLGYDKCAA